MNENLKLRIEGMDCEGCATGIENMLRMRDLVGRLKPYFSGSLTIRRVAIKRGTKLAVSRGSIR